MMDGGVRMRLGIRLGMERAEHEVLLLVMVP